MTIFGKTAEGDMKPDGGGVENSDRVMNELCHLDLSSGESIHLVRGESLLDVRTYEI